MRQHHQQHTQSCHLFAFVHLPLSHHSPTTSPTDLQKDWCLHGCRYQPPPYQPEGVYHLSGLQQSPSPMCPFRRM
uniref:Uncharacterized protein n=1 Tax=Arundo donax TaxID=35708 RepID=A0A0A9HN22_ARUDO